MHHKTLNFNCTSSDADEIGSDSVDGGSSFHNDKSMDGNVWHGTKSFLKQNFF